LEEFTINHVTCTSPCLSKLGRWATYHMSLMSGFQYVMMSLIPNAKFPKETRAFKPWNRTSEANQRPNTLRHRLKYLSGNTSLKDLQTVLTHFISIPVVLHQRQYSPSGKFGDTWRHLAATSIGRRVLLASTL
jgi:hypothetical protein